MPIRANYTLLRSRGIYFGYGPFELQSTLQARYRADNQIAGASNPLFAPASTQKAGVFYD